MLRLGRPGPVPTPEEAAAYPYTAEERGFVEDRLAGQVIGSPETVRAGVTELGLASQPDFWARVDALGERKYYPAVDMKGMPA